MQTILLIRHAKAEERETWTKDDDLRPLTKAGHRQALAFATNWGADDIKTIRSSPAVRCVQTVQPLAERANVPIITDNSLMEGSKVRLPPLESTGLHIICAHGDNIPWLLDEFQIKWKECRKGSTWIVKRDSNGRVVESRYMPPP